MATTTSPTTARGSISRERMHTRSASEWAFLLLRSAFTVAPILFGIDKLTNLLADWTQYLAPWIDAVVPGDARFAMYGVGLVEIAAGVLVALAPRWGGLVVAAWLLGIIVNLLTLPGYFDVALRDVGLLAGALALALLARDHDRRARLARRAA
ncbi:DoxX family membrane protein [Agrococcus sp. HG114]|uniref:DoxX family membrane protein n=1 Tax=Agrococcus sp. HG114 TaxID=2969757 RepID=UPI00215B6906|nr:DoxX family membrane protein [Agrococcus sp. HG114]MCR8671679.1 DoxX family membrane protein [Agrococcus sp. HG114]